MYYDRVRPNPRMKSLLLIAASVNESLLWLKHNRGSLEEVQGHWRKTSKARYNLVIANSEASMSKYFDDYKVLTESWGHKLMSIDFQELYNLNDTDIYVQCPLFFERFYESADKRNFRKIGGLLNSLNEDISESK